MDDKQNLRQISFVQKVQKLGGVLLSLCEQIRRSCRLTGYMTRLCKAWQCFYTGVSAKRN